MARTTRCVAGNGTERHDSIRGHLVGFASGYIMWRIAQFSKHRSARSGHLKYEPEFDLPADVAALDFHLLEKGAAIGCEEKRHPEPVPRSASCLSSTEMKAR